MITVIVNKVHVITLNPGKEKERNDKFKKYHSFIIKMFSFTIKFLCLVPSVSSLTKS